MYPFIKIGSLVFMSYPVCMALALTICLIALFSGKKYDIFLLSRVMKVLSYGAVGAALGGKILYALTRIGKGNFSLFDLLGGFVFYGGFLGALGGIAVFCTRTKNRFLDLADLFASILPLGQAVGRLGCYLNGCCYGREYDGFLSVWYPVNGELTKVFPTWFLESGFCFLLFLGFWLIRSRKKSGFYLSTYLMVYPAFRFGVEFLRGDVVRGIWFGGLSTSQILSLGLFFCGFWLSLFSFFYIMSINLIFNEDKNTSPFYFIKMYL